MKVSISGLTWLRTRNLLLNRYSNQWHCWFILKFRCFTKYPAIPVDAIISGADSGTVYYTISFSNYQSEVLFFMLKRFFLHFLLVDTCRSNTILFPACWEKTPHDNKQFHIVLFTKCASSQSDKSCYLPCFSLAGEIKVFTNLQANNSTNDQCLFTFSAPFCQTSEHIVQLNGRQTSKNFKYARGQLKRTLQDGRWMEAYTVICFTRSRHNVEDSLENNTRERSLAMTYCFLKHIYANITCWVIRKY